jgi:hypothetical protein
MCVLFKPVQSALALFVAWICTDHTNHAFAADDFAVAANFFDRSRNSHFTLLKLFCFHAMQGMELGSVFVRPFSPTLF